jgi:hypothetical protein
LATKEITEGNALLGLAERVANSFSFRVGSFVDRRRQQRDYDRYLSSGMPPFTSGYHFHKWDVIRNTLADANLMETFKLGGTLPKNFGRRLDERVVEYPWLLSRLASTPGTLLDAGSALNFQALLDLPVFKEKTVHIVTLHPEAHCFWKRSVSYAFADLRDLFVRDNFYDDIVCISTLEHIGLNTEIYTNERVEQLEVENYKHAAAELWRVLKPGGHLYLTVPFGKACELDWLQQFDSSMVQDLVEQLGPSEVSVTHYRYDADGWKLSNESECRHAEYTAPEKWGVAEFLKEGQASHEELGEGTPAAAGAVVCLDLLK